MRKNYLGLWILLVVAFVVFAIVSCYDNITVFGYELKSSKIFQTISGENKNELSQEKIQGASERVAKSKPSKSVPVDTASKTILFIGDSMLEGLSPRLGHYAKQNGHKLYSVIWYSSTSEVWGRSGKLASYIKKLHPDYIFICLGSNELFVSDIAEKRDKYVKQIIKEIGSIPYVWIGPPNWKEDTGINDLIASNVPVGSFFVSNGMHFDRSRDGAHPTRASASLWMDSVARWMPVYSRHPIKMSTPRDNTGRPVKVFVHQPDEK